MRSIPDFYTKNNSAAVIRGSVRDEYYAGGLRLNINQPACSILTPLTGCLMQIQTDRITGKH